ncbi:MAG: CPBP family intramembrane metalloprotease [Alteromonadaceae bacterium]|nr:CPBP family intramembrane metalloprotease [Alteromonadaceae bacterium]
MFRLGLGIIIYICSRLLADELVTDDITALNAHGVCLILAVVIPCIIKSQGLRLGRYSLRSIWLVLVSFCIFKFLQVAVIIESKPQNMTGNIYTYYVIGLALVSIGEELFFRGVLFEDLKLKYNIYVASVVSVCFFTLIHFSNSVEYLTFNLISGVVFVVLRIKYKGILMPLLAHLFGNWTVFFYLNGI